MGKRDEGERDGVFTDRLVEDDAVHRPAEVDVHLFLEHLNEIVQAEKNKQRQRVYVSTSDIFQNRPKTS